MGFLGAVGVMTKLILIYSTMLDFVFRLGRYTIKTAAAHVALFKRQESSHSITCNTRFRQYNTSFSEWSDQVEAGVCVDYDRVRVCYTIRVQL